MKMKSKSEKRFNKFTTKLQSGVKIKMKIHRTDGQDCEGGVENLEHIEKAEDFKEVVCVNVATEDSEKASEIGQKCT